MRQDHQQQIGIAQRQMLSQSARQLVQLIVAPPAEVADLVDRLATDNPFLSVSRAFPRGGGLQADSPSPQPSLFAHVLAELPMLVRKPADLPIAARLAEGLDERGFLADGVPEIAADLKVPVARVEAVLSQLQGIEPTGLFARSASECLALQLRTAGQLDEAAVCLLCNRDELAASGAADFARRHGLDPGRLTQLIDLIAKLARNPAAAFGETAAAAIPELQFERTGDEWSVRLILQSAPHLTLRHAAYASALGEAADAAARSALRGKWREACALHQAAGLRDATLERLGKQLLLLQRTGLESRLTKVAPLTRRELAMRLSVHESTVGRMVSNRFAMVEGKIVPLGRFFERPMAARESAPLTRSIVLDALRKLIASDPAAATMSDLALSRKLAGSGIAVTRRRLGKYREILGIPCSRRRRTALATCANKGDLHVQS